MSGGGKQFQKNVPIPLEVPEGYRVSERDAIKLLGRDVFLNQDRPIVRRVWWWERWLFRLADRKLKRSLDERYRDAKSRCIYCWEELLINSDEPAWHDACEQETVHES